MSVLVGTCECCGFDVFADEDYISVDGIILCEYCAERYLFENSIPEELNNE